ncbi:unnamed protein product [Phytophthora lilii]|uniref:Unnamed protein product n=1 Tax=Phytophthora lilii TaxID=2077276 RepID=A0A9W6X7A0_9STRA|nr:unnamed protein product [Phytophthora lilii]
MMYAWYFPKGFWGASASSRHDWANFVVWIDNPAIENPQILGVSFSKSEDTYEFQTKIYETAFMGYRALYGSAILDFSILDGEYQDLIMWEQMTDEVRAALVDSNFDDFEVPFNEDKTTSTPTWKKRGRFEQHACCCNII